MRYRFGRRIFSIEVARFDDPADFTATGRIWVGAAAGGGALRAGPLGGRPG